MNWEAVGAIGELIGAIAVILTLVYLAIQIRQNTRSMDESRNVELARNRTQEVQLRAEWMLLQASSDDLAEMYNKLNDAGWPDPKCLEVLTPIELRKLKWLQLVNLMVNESSIYKHDLGVLDDVGLERSQGVFRTMGPIWKELGLPRSFLPDEDGDT